MDMSGDMQGMDMPAAPTKMEMGGMQGGKAPADARNSDDYSDGYRNSTLPNYEMADQISIPKVLRRTGVCQRQRRSGYRLVGPGDQRNRQQQIMAQVSGLEKQQGRTA
jgi:hypothetical protein